MLMMKSENYFETQKMIKELKTTTIIGLLGIVFSLTPVNTLQAHNKSTKEEQSKITRVDSEAILLADRAKINFEVIAVDSILLRMGLGLDDEMFPADELHDAQWNTEYVKVYAETLVPDSFTIDVSSFVMPFEGPVTSNYGPRRRRFHYGTDFKLQTGDTVRAAFEGKVRVRQYERRGYGYYLVLRHPNGLETVYGHLSEFLVEQDEVVKAGDPIGLGGNTGRSTGSHLHFEFRFLGNPINPGEIIDFEEFTAKDDRYVFTKKQSGNAYASSSSAKYVAQGTNSTAKSSGKVQYYRIRQGDTLGAIARKNRTTVDKLCRLNKIKPTTTLRIGKSIRVS